MCLHCKLIVALFRNCNRCSIVLDLNWKTIERYLIQSILIQLKGYVDVVLLVRSPSSTPVTIKVGAFVSRLKFTVFSVAFPSSSSAVIFISYAPSSTSGCSVILATIQVHMCIADSQVIDNVVQIVIPCKGCQSSFICAHDLWINHWFCLINREGNLLCILITCGILTVYLNLINTILCKCVSDQRRCCCRIISGNLQILCFFLIRCWIKICSCCLNRYRLCQIRSPPRSVPGTLPALLSVVI